MKTRIPKGYLFLGLALLLLLATALRRSPSIAIDRVSVSASSSDSSDEEATVAEGDEAESGSKADYREKSAALQDRLAKVTVYSDRAELTRIGKVKLKPGTQWLRFDEIASGFYPNTARVVLGEGFSGRIVQVAGEEVFSKGILKAETRAKVDRLRSLYAELLGVSQQAQATEHQLAFVRSLKFEMPFQRSPASTVYRPFSATIDSLRTSIDEIHAKTSSLLARSERNRAEMTDLRERIALIENELQNQASTRDQDWKTTFFVLVESKANQTASLELHYQVPNALWRPIYDIRAELDHDKGVAEIKLVTAGMIEQKTGEDWKQVGVTLSSLDPVSLYLPKMNRWLLKERRTEAPVPMKVAKSDFGARGKAKERARKQEMSAANEVDALSALRQEGAMDQGIAAGGAAPAAAPALQMADKEMDMPLEEKALKKAIAPSRRDAYVDQDEKLGAKDNAASFEQEGGRSPASLFTLDRLESIYPTLGRYSRAVEEANRSQRVQPLDAKLVTATAERIDYTDSRLPAVQAHGRRIEFASPFPVDVRTDESPLKVPVHTQSLVGKLSYYAIPKNDTRVFLRAQTTNTTDHPILGGAAQVFMAGDLVSKTDLGTVSEDAYFNVDLGVDRNVETKRIVTRNSKTSGIISSTHHTEVAVKIELANHHPYAIEMEVKDNYPRSPDKKIEAMLTQVEPDVEKNEKEYGVITWKVRVPARSKKTVSFSYEVAHPDNYLVSEFN